MYIDVYDRDKYIGKCIVDDGQFIVNDFNNIVAVLDAVVLKSKEKISVLYIYPFGYGQLNHGEIS